MSTPSTAARPASAPEPTHACVRCGRPVPLDVAMCEVGNPLGLRQPASSQVHGTVAAALVLAVVLLAVAGRVVLSGVGPFRASVLAVEPAAPGLAVTIDVANGGSRAGSTTCRITLASRPGMGGAALVLTPQIEPGESRQVTTRTSEFGSEPVALAVTCRDP